ncbi:MAG: YkuS family protein [Candidatus Contubernalis sp.]|nr:YkuS family protein [Candidatus Contubernalis sp.]
MTKLVVMVQDGLDDVGRRLKQEGYKVVDVDDTAEKIDAIVFSPSQAHEAGSLHSDVMLPGGNNGFVVMINADEKSDNDILSMLENIK